MTYSSYREELKEEGLVLLEEMGYFKTFDYIVGWSPPANKH